MDMKLELVVVPVSDVDRAKAFYEITQAAPGSTKGLHLVVTDIEAAHAELAGRGVAVSDPFHFGARGQTPGVDPERRSYGSFATFEDPDGNVWLVQEVTQPEPRG